VPVLVLLRLEGIPPLPRPSFIVDEDAETDSGTSGERKREGRNRCVRFPQCSIPRRWYPRNANPTADFPRRPIDPRGPSYVHPLRWGTPPAKAMKSNRSYTSVTFQANFWRVFSKLPPDPHKEGRARCRCMGREKCGVDVVTRLGTFNASIIWSLEILTVRRAVGERSRTDLCRVYSIYAPWDATSSERTNVPSLRGFHAWYQLRRAIGFGGTLGRNVEPRT
jgi:hypothetical protein